MFDGVNVHVGITVKEDKVVLIAFVIAEKEVFAMTCVMACPILLCYSNCRGFGMLDVLKRDVELVE